MARLWLMHHAHVLVFAFVNARIATALEKQMVLRLQKMLRIALLAFRIELPF